MGELVSLRMFKSPGDLHVVERLLDGVEREGGQHLEVLGLAEHVVEADAGIGAWHQAIVRTS